MNLYYTADNRQMASINYMNLETKNIVSNQFQGIMNDVAYIFKHIFKISSINVNLISRDECYELVMNIAIFVKTKVGVFKVILGNNNFRIINNDISLQFEVHFKDTGKVFSLELPIETIKFVDPTNLYCLKEDMDINNLIELYRKRLMILQNAFDKEQCDTIIGIWQKIDDYFDYNKKGIKLDEVSLRKGFVLDFQLGYLNLDNDLPVILILKNGTYTLMGYNTKNNESLDLKHAIKLLERRKQELS